PARDALFKASAAKLRTTVSVQSETVFLYPLKGTSIRVRLPRCFLLQSSMYFAPLRILLCALHVCKCFPARLHRASFARPCEATGHGSQSKTAPGKAPEHEEKEPGRLSPWFLFF